MTNAKFLSGCMVTYDQCSTKNCVLVLIPSTKAVDTMDLAWVRCHCWLRRYSVVRDFAVTALTPTVFYLKLLYLQVMFRIRKSCRVVFLASVWKQDGCQSRFKTSFLSFSSSSDSGSVIAIVLNFSAEIISITRGCLRKVFLEGVDVCSLAWRANFMISPL